MKNKTKPAAAGDKKETQVRYTKEQALFSRRYQEHRDLLNAVLADSGTYSMEEIENKIEAYQKGKVK